MLIHSYATTKAGYFITFSRGVGLGLRSEPFLGDTNSFSLAGLRGHLVKSGLVFNIYSPNSENDLHGGPD